MKNKKDLKLKNYCNFEFSVGENFLFECIKKLVGVDSGKINDDKDMGDEFEKLLKDKSETYIDDFLDPKFVKEYYDIINFNSYMKISSDNGKFKLIINNICDRRNLKNPKFMAVLIINFYDEKLEIDRIKNKIVFSIETLDFKKFYDIIQKYIDKNKISESNYIEDTDKEIYIDYKSKGYMRKGYLYVSLLSNLVMLGYIIKILI